MDARLPALLTLLQAVAPAPAPAPPPAPGIMRPGAPPPPPPAPAAAPVEPPLPGEVPPASGADMPKINIEPTYPQVKLIKFLGIVWLILTGVVSMMFNGFFLMADDTLYNVVVVFALNGAGIALGLVAFVKEDLRKWFGYISAFLIIGGLAARPAITPLTTSDVIYVLPAALFAWFFFLYYEYLDAYQRFTDVARMAVERSLMNFNLKQVIQNFLTRGLFLSFVFMAVALGILSLLTQLLGGALGPELAASIEMQTVFGQAMAITIVFTLIAVLWTFLFVLLERRTEVEQVAYSREQIAGMVDHGSQPGGPSGPAGPAPGAGVTLGGIAPRQ